MKKFLYILMISILFHTNMSYGMEQDILLEQTSNIYKNLPTLTICGVIIGLIGFNLGFYSETIKKELHKILFGKSVLTPAKLNEKALSFAKTSKISADIAKYDIYQACEYGAIERVKELLQDQNLDINKPRNYKIENKTNTETPLHIACQKQHPQIVELLLSHPDIDVNKKDNCDNTALILAYCYGRQYKRVACDHSSILLGVNLETVQKLLDDKRVDINHNAQQLLSLACKDNNETFIKQLLYDPRIKCDNNLPLCYACENENVKIVKLLLQMNVENCMNINKCRDDPTHKNPLLIICSQIRKYDEELKLEEGINARQGIADKMMHFLLDETTSQKIQKIKINRTRCIKIFNLLLNDPAIQIDTPENCVTALHLCTSDHTLLLQLLSRTTQSINKLMVNDYLFNSCSGKNYTPLHMAMKEGSLESILLLIERGADITIKNSDSKLPLKLLSQNSQNLLIFKALLEKNFIAKKDLDENHCLVESIENPYNNNNAVPRLLLESGANPNQKSDDRWNFSPLFVAAKYDLSLLNLCLDRYKGNYKQKNQSGETILYTAFKRKIIKNIHHINFLKKLDPQKRKEYMLYELESAAHYDPRSVKQEYSSFGHYNPEKLKEDMELFSLFLNKCICFGNINLTEKIEGKSLLDVTFENITNVQVCKDEDDKDKHLYREIILHTFMRCVKPVQYRQLSDDLKVHYKLVQTYKNNLHDYYYYIILNKKEEQQQYLRSIIQSEMNSNPSDKTGPLSSITCSIF